MTEIRRRKIGVSVNQNKAGYTAHLLYIVSYTDGTDKIIRGKTLLANDSKLAAAKILLNDIEEACQELDTKSLEDV